MGKNKKHIIDTNFEFNLFHKLVTVNSNFAACLGESYGFVT